jgi:hypothetical protein
MQWEKDFDEVLGRLRSRARNGEAVSSDDFESISNLFDQKYQRENPTHIAAAEVVLVRDGKCNIQPIGYPLNWPQEQEVANYIFMFVRDLFHSHYHHPDSDDALVPLCGHPTDWARETEKSLYRAVIAARRFKRPSDLAEAAGRLAYLKHFREHFEVNDPARDLIHLGMSIEASAEQSKAAGERRALTTTVIFAIPFAIFEVVVHVDELVKEDIKIGRDHFKIEISQVYQLLSCNLTISLFLIALFLLSYGVFAGMLDVKRLRITKAIIRAFTVALTEDSIIKIRGLALSGIVLILLGASLIFLPVIFDGQCHVFLP